MKDRIQKSMILLILLTMFSTIVLMTVLIFNESLNEMKRDVIREANDIKMAVSISRSGELQTVSRFFEETRITLIAEDGKVLYDSRDAASKMENHKNRTEFQSALQRGEGATTRHSNTLGKRTYYYAVKLDSGNVLRIASETQTVWTTMKSISFYILGIGLILIALSILFARWQTRRLIEPINQIDMEHPKSGETYPELEPLLQAIEDYNREREEATKMRQEFTANVTHELKTPLTSISGYAEIISNGLVKPEDVNGFAQRIYNEAKRLIALVEDLIRLSKLDEGGIQLEKEQVDLFELIKEIRIRLALIATKRNITMEVSGEPVQVFGIRQILDEMIYNVCENGIKYNIVGGTLKIWAGNTIEGPRVVVQDTGIGIPKEDHKRIFERFFRVDKSHSKAIGGTGLGLSIVKHGALLHHVKIVVNSTEGVGTKITFLFPKTNEELAVANQDEEKSFDEKSSSD